MKKIKKNMMSRKREKQTRYLSQAIQLEEAVNPHIIRATMTMVSLAIVGFIIWAGCTNINEVARTPGEIVPYGDQKTVQHWEGGIVKTIHVREGDVVSEGQTLITLDEASIKEDLERALGKDTTLAMQAERLRAFLDGRQPDFSAFSEAHPTAISDQESFFEGMRVARQKEEQIIKEQIEEKKQTIEALESDLQTARRNYGITNDMYQRRVQLNRKGYATDMQILEDRQKLNDVSGEINRIKNQLRMAETAINEYKGRLESLSAQHRDEAYEKLSKVNADKEQNVEVIEKLQERIGRLHIRAPAHGLVKGLAVNTVGAVIQHGQIIMEIVPLDTHLEAEVKISPQDIGHLKVGQSVQVKFSTFDFSRYGSVKGKLDHISATTFSGESGERYYQGRVSLEKKYVGSNPDNLVVPGMTVMADVITGKKTILQYMLKPIHVSLKTAFTER